MNGTPGGWVTSASIQRIPSHQNRPSEVNCTRGRGGPVLRPPLCISLTMPNVMTPMTSTTPKMRPAIRAGSFVSTDASTTRCAIPLMHSKYTCYAADATMTPIHADGLVG